MTKQEVVKALQEVVDFVSSYDMVSREEVELVFKAKEVISALKAE